LTHAVIVDAVRTPFGRHGGVLSGVRPDDLAASVLRALVARAKIDPALVDDVILGCANQAGEDNRNVARMAALLAGFPVEVPGQTVNRLCGSGMQAVISAAHTVMSGDASCIIAGGVESMSRAPWVMLKPLESHPRSAPPMADSTLGWRFINPAMPREWTISLGETAELVAQRYGITREDQDAYALESQKRTAAAISRDHFADEIIPVVVREKGSERRVERDEHPRPGTTIEQLRTMKAAFARDGSVTAGSSSGINDGASAVLVMSAAAARARGAAPLARVVATGVAGVSPEVMGIGPVPAAGKALARANLDISQMDLVELNEAFASQTIACIRELGVDPGKVNVNGGAIALGHPLGASGSRIVGALAFEMRRRDARYGLAAMCIGVGQGIAIILERP
jgi:3-oxoadipyl-CoA thiolase